MEVAFEPRMLADSSNLNFRFVGLWDMGGRNPKGSLSGDPLHNNRNPKVLHPQRKGEPQVT